MTRYSKFNIVYRLQKWMDSVPGQTFLNYAYSWGASIVILGTLFKLTHLPGANLMLYIGMGTEVFVFFISAFDRPFDKTAIGMDLPTRLSEEDLEVEGKTDDEESIQTDTEAVAAAVGNVVIQSAGGQPVIVGEGEVAGSVPAAAVTGQSQAWMAQQQEVSPEMAEATSNYVDELKKLTEMLSKVSEQSQRLTRDSEEMENLNRTLTGICKVYEMQLKGASAQIGTIDQINEQTRKMASQIDQLNKIYARMIEAMTVNMRAAAPGATINNE